MKKKNTILSIIAITILMIALIGASFAYFFSSSVGSEETNVSVRTSIGENGLLSFQISNDIEFSVTSDNLSQSVGNNVYGEATVTATLTPRDLTQPLTMNYSVYLSMELNPIVYSETNPTHKPELMLQVFDSNNQSVTLHGLGNVVTQNGVSGYDITEKEGIITILENHAITADGAAEIENWKVKVTFINLEEDQTDDNGGKTITGTISIKRITNTATNCNGDCIDILAGFIPATNGLNATVSCDNATATYNNTLNQLELSAISDVSSQCEVTYTKATNTVALNNYIISLENTTQGDGTVIHETVDEFTTIDNKTTIEAGYRYEGKNPNNYVWFNNELWRIIGVFGPESHGQTGKQLVKIIRNNGLGGLVWDKNNIINWNSSSLKTLFNDSYYNQRIDTDNCYANGSSYPPTCDYSSQGIANRYRKMIENVDWFLGSAGKDGYNNRTASFEYIYERQGIIYSQQNPNRSEGKVGLIYLSDYLYGAKESDCARSTIFDSYNTNNCAGKNWLFNGIMQWTINASSRTDKVYYINQVGLVALNYSGLGYSIRPVLYLSNLVYKTGGTGTQSDPYIIGM